MITDKICDLEVTRDRLKLGGGPERADKQHKSGKLTARERVTLILDRDSFQQAGLFAKHQDSFVVMGDKALLADGVVTGRGRIAGRPVHVASQDFTVAGGSAGGGPTKKTVAPQKEPQKTSAPLLSST